MERNSSIFSPEIDEFLLNSNFSLWHDVEEGDLLGTYFTVNHYDYFFGINSSGFILGNAKYDTMNAFIPFSDYEKSYMNSIEGIKKLMSEIFSKFLGCDEVFLLKNRT